MAKSAVFINPPVYDFSAFDLWSKPYGLLFIVDLFVKNNWDIYYFDFMDRNHPFYQDRKKDKRFGCGNYFSQIVEKPSIYVNIPRKYKRFGLPQNIFLEFLEGIKDVDVILISCGMTYWYKGVQEIVNICKKMKKVPVILGGAYPTFCSEHARNIGADMVFEGANIRDFVSKFNKCTGFQLRYVEKCTPYWQVYEKLSYLVVRTGFGCPFSCYYCGVQKIYQEYLLRDIDEVVEEVNENVSRYSVRHIAFYDDALFCHFETHLKKILEKIISAHKDLNFHTPNGIHPKYITPDLGFFLKDAGFKTLRLSVETFDEKRQKESSFKVCLSEFENAMKNLVDAKFSKQEIGVYILAGLPDQNIEDVAGTIKFLKQFPCEIKIAEYSPIPGTIDFELSKRLYPALPLDEPLYQNNSIFPLWNFEGKWEKINWLKNLAKS
ncbi:MAG: B12-binding domain-containing radical SAM protein [Candidatus Ratteibacteria bacterium]